MPVTGFAVSSIAPMYYVIIAAITSQSWMKVILEEKEKQVCLLFVFVFLFILELYSPFQVVSFFSLCMSLTVFFFFSSLPLLPLLLLLPLLPLLLLLPLLPLHCHHLCFIKNQYVAPRASSSQRPLHDDADTYMDGYFFN